MLTDNDRSFGPLTLGRSFSRRHWSLCLSSDGVRGARAGIYLWAAGWVFCLDLPKILRGSDGDERRYGISLYEGLFSIDYGLSTMDSSTEQRWSKFLPWTQWRHVRTSLYGLKGELLCDEPKQYWGWDVLKQAVPKAKFALVDYDGTEVVATTHIEEREWRFGEGWFKWLSWFREPKICRSLDIEFSQEVGPGKGSWKGGTVGHGIDLPPGELHESAMWRYCAQQRDHKGTKYRIKFVGPVND